MKKAQKLIKQPALTNFFIVVIISLIFYISIIQKQGIIYSMNDDIAMKAISSGKYTGTPSMHMIFSGFPFSFILIILNKITNKIDWYGLILIISTMFFFSYTVYNIIKSEKEIFKKIIYGIIAFSLVGITFSNFLVELTFTSVASFIATCCLILYLLPESKTKNVIMSLGILLSFGIRQKACLMIIIFFVPALIYKNYRNKEKIKKDIMLGIKIAIALLICIIVEKSLYTDLNWKQYLEYNNFRSLYYDYYYDTLKNLPPEESRQIFHDAGFTDKEMELLKRYKGIAFYDDMPSKVENLITQCKIQGVKINSNIMETIKEVMTSFTNICYVITLALMVCTIILSKNKKEKFISLFPFIILQILILLYLCIQGRIPDRVLIPLQVCYILTNICMAKQEPEIDKYLNKILTYNKTITTILVLIIFIISIRNIHINDENIPLVEKGENIEQYFMAHPENFYIYDNDYLIKFTIKNRFYNNSYINKSGWTAFSPVHEEAIKAQNANSLRELLFKENVYMVIKSKDVDLYTDVSDNIQIYEQGDVIGDYHIYKYTK